MRILVVDNDRAGRTHIAELLRSAGYADLDEAESALEAFTLLGIDSGEGKGFDMVLMSTDLPEIGGLEACRRIKSVDRLQDLAVLITSPHVTTEMLEAAFDAGAIDCFATPVNRVELMARIGSVHRMVHEIDMRKAREKELAQLKHQLAEANRVLAYLSAIDGQTGIATREHIERALDHEWRRATRGPTPLSAIMMDIDFFKIYNDFYGRQAGEACLLQVTRSLSGTMHRPADLLARFGGEQFMVLLPDTHIQGAVAIAEAMRANVEMLAIPHARSQVSDYVTISLGVATAVPTVETPPTTLLKAAEQALMQAKRGGRNRVIVQVLD